MSSYVNLYVSTDMYHEIIGDLVSYCSELDNYYCMKEAVHLIDALDELYQEDMDKQDKEFQQWREYEKLFEERFVDEVFRDEDDNINEKGMHEYKNFHKVNSVLEDYKEGGTLDILDEKQQFFLVLDLINAIDRGVNGV